ncbi:MAG: helical backbone metal receptor [Deltaproteobacteria bacterium]|nr:helical backbone metal receptor [Deltaproteobacteria bacterium]
MATIRMDRREALAVIAASLAACKPTAATQQSTRRAVRRIISLAPNTTEMLFALGLGERVVAVSQHCDFPDEVRDLPRLSGFGSVSLEGILGFRPDLVVGAPGISRATLTRLEALGIATYFEPVEHLADIRVLAHSLAERCASPDSATRWLTTFDAGLARHASRAPLLDGRSVLAVVDQRPIVCGGPGSFVDEVLRRAGARNALTTGPAWPQLSLEAVFSLAPAVVLDLTSVLSQEPLARAWSQHHSIPAVRDGTILAVREPLVTRPGPRAIEAITLVRRALDSLTEVAA